MSERLNSQSTNNNSATTAPGSADHPATAAPIDNQTVAPPDNTAIVQNHTPTSHQSLSHQVSQCPTLHSFVLIQTPKPTPAPPDPADLPDYEPAQPPANGETLSPQQQQAIQLLLQGLTDSAVARRLGLNRKTIHRWKWYTPLFYNTLDEAQRQAWNEAYGLLRSSILQSAHTLNHLVKKGNPQQALQAARILLSNTVLTRLEG